MATTDLEQVKELTKGSIELLNAVGVESLVALAESGSSSLHAEIEQANDHLELLEDGPTAKEVEAWIKKACGITGKKERVKEPQLKVLGFSRSSLPVALAVKKEQILKSKIAVGDVPVMVDFVEEDSSETFVKEVIKIEEETEETPGGRKKEKRKKKSTKKKRSKQDHSEAPVSTEREQKREIEPRGMPSRQKASLGNFNRLEEGEESRPVVEPLKRNTGFDIRKTASPQLNEGKKLHSRSYIRGVLHPQPVRVKVAALISLMAFILLPLSFVAGGLIIFKDSVPIEQPLWLLAVPATFLFFGFLYLVVAKPLKCRICGQPLLASKACFRHVKAHRFPLIGYILPTSLHMLLFHWFRCIYCGTSVRLKE